MIVKTKINPAKMKNKNFASQLAEKRPILVLIGFLFLGVLALSLSRGTLFRGFLSLEDTNEFDQQMDNLNIAADEPYISVKSLEEPEMHPEVNLHTSPIQVDHDLEEQAESSWDVHKPVVFKASNDAGTLRGLLAESEAFVHEDTLYIADYSQSTNTEITKVQFDFNNDGDFDDEVDVTITEDSDGGGIYLAKVNRPSFRGVIDIVLDDAQLAEAELTYKMRVEDAAGRHDEAQYTVEMPEQVEVTSTIECGVGARPPSENDVLVSALWTVVDHQIDLGDGSQDADPANWEYEWTFTPAEASLALEDDGRTAAVTHDKPLEDGAMSIDATVTATYTLDPELVVSDTCTYELEPSEVAADFNILDYIYLPAGEHMGDVTGVEFTFDNNTSFENISIDDYSWDFGDGSEVSSTGSSVDRNATHTFDYPIGNDNNNPNPYTDEYTVTISATDSLGEVHQSTEQVEVQKPLMADAECLLEIIPSPTEDDLNSIDSMIATAPTTTTKLASRNLLSFSAVEAITAILKITITDQTQVLDQERAPGVESLHAALFYQGQGFLVTELTPEILAEDDRTVTHGAMLATITAILQRFDIEMPQDIAAWNAFLNDVTLTYVATNEDGLRDTVEVDCHFVELIDNGQADLGAAAFDVSAGAAIDAEPLRAGQFDVGDFGIQFPGLFANPFAVTQSAFEFDPSLFEFEPDAVLTPEVLEAIWAAAEESVEEADIQNELASVPYSLLSEFDSYHMINAVEGMSVYFEPTPYCEDIEVAVAVYPFDSLENYIGDVEAVDEVQWADVLSEALENGSNGVQAQAEHIVALIHDYASYLEEFGEFDENTLSELLALAAEDTLPEEKPAADPLDPAAYFTLNANGGAAVCAPSFEPEVTCEVLDGEEEGEYLATLIVKGVEGQIAMEDGSERVYYDFSDNSEQEGNSGDILGADGIQSVIDSGVIASYIYNQESDPQLHDEDGNGNTYTAKVIYQELVLNDEGDWAEPEDGGEFYSPECVIPDLDPEETIDAVDDEYSILQGDAAELTILKNDSQNGAGIDESNIGMEIVADPLHGTAEILRDADENPYAILYTADADFVGEDDFKYRIYDLVDSNPEDAAVVTINVEAAEATLTLDCIEADLFNGEGHATLDAPEGFGEYAPLYSWRIDYDAEEPLSAVLAGWIVDEETGEVTKSDDFTFDISNLVSDYGSYEMTMDAYMVDPGIEEFDIAELIAVASASATCTWEEDVEPEPEPEDLPEEELDAECSIINIVEGDDNVVDQSLNYVDCSEYTYIDESVTIINNYYYGDEEEEEEEVAEEVSEDEEEDQIEDAEDLEEEESEPEDVDEIVDAEAGKLGCYDIGSYIPYKDVPNTDLYEPIRFFSKVSLETIVGDQHVVHGYPGNVFRPNGNTTRAEGVKMLMLSMCANDLAKQKYGAIDDLLDDDPFEDVPRGDWFADKAAVAHKMGLIKGFTIDQQTGEEVRGPIPYRPQQIITRAEFVKILTELYLAWNPDIQFNHEDYYYAEDGEGFNDVTGYEWADPYFNFMREQEIFRGTESGNARGGDPITRLEAMIILYNTVAKLTENDSELTELYFGLSRE